ncbi:hypothetical protein BHL51_14005, partial [Bacillus cereus]
IKVPYYVNYGNTFKYFSTKIRIYLLLTPKSRTTYLCMLQYFKNVKVTINKKYQINIIDL